MTMMEAKPEYMRPSDPGQGFTQVPEGRDLDSESMSPFERANTIPKSNRELEADMPGVLHRCMKLISGIKKSVADMRAEAEAASCYREKCSIILSTAIGASVALDQALYSGNLGANNEQELRVLCSEVQSALALGSARIRVYGRQPRWKKYAKRLLQRSPNARFEEVIDKLNELTQQAWSLQTNVNPGAASSRFHLARIKPSRRSSTTFSAHRSMPESPVQAVEATLPSSLPHVLLCRTHLRRGAQRFWVKSLLYISPERSSGPKKPLGQVWWYCAGLCFGRLAVHNVATSETKAISISQNMPAVVVMAQDIHGDVWTGHKDGYVRIWSESSHNPVCPAFKAMHSDIRCITTDDDGNAWVGSDAGNVKKIELVNLKQPAGGLSKWLNVRVVLKWSRDSPLNSSAEQSSDSAPTDTMRRASHFTASRLGRSSDSAESRRAHEGPVAALSTQGERVWTSGGVKENPTLRLWSHKGAPRCSVPLHDIGAANAIKVMPQFVNVVQRNSAAGSPAGTAVASPQAGAGGCKDLLAMGSMGNRMESDMWQLLTAHKNGQCLLWDISDPMSFQPIAKFAVPGSPARALLLCEEIGLWGTAHTDGTVELRLLPTGAPDERFTLELEPGKPVPSVNIPQFRAPFCAHRGGLLHAVGCGATMVTAGRFGAVTLWPEAELRSIAEGAGFVLPTRAPQGVEPSGAVTRQATISQVLQRYFTPQSAAMAEYALANAVINRVKGQKAKNPDEPHLSPIASLGSKESEEAQMIIVEVANLLRSSASSANVGVEAMRGMASASSSLVSDPERMPSIGADAASQAALSAGAVSAEKPSLWGRMAHSPSAPMPLRGGAQKDEGEDGLGMQPGIGYSPHPSAPTLGDMGDLGQPLVPGSQSSSVEPHFRSTSLNALAGTWTIPFSELVLKKQIGEGSIGKVHLGKWRETDVAVKVLNSLSSICVAEAEESEVSMDAAKSVGSESHESQLPDNRGPLATLEREVNIMAALRHPNIVLFMGVCLDPPCVVSEWCARGSLFDVLQKARKNSALAPQLDWTRRLNMALDAAKGMLQLHSKHIVHRDLKSPNLLVDKHWRVKIGDFNLSRVEDTEEKTTSITANNPRWLAPEVISMQAYSKAADVFSFGVILWELITWQLPWEELGVFQIMVSVAEKNQRPDIPAEPDKLPGGTFEGWAVYVALIQRCWTMEPGERPTFEAIINDLRELLTESASQTRQRRLTDPQSSAQPAVSGELRQRSGPLGASDDLPVQPPAPPGHRQDNPTIDLKDVAHLSQHTGVQDNQNEGMSTDSPSGFTIPIPRSDDSQGTNRSSIDFRRLSSSSARRSASLDNQRTISDRRRRFQREAALSAHAANDRALLLLSGYRGGPEHRESSGSNMGQAGNSAPRPVIAGIDRRPEQGRDEDLAPHDPSGRQALAANLQSAFASSSNLRFSEDRGRPPLSGERRSTDTEGGRSSGGGRSSSDRMLDVGEPPTRTSLEQLNRAAPASEGAVPEKELRGLNLPPQAGLANFRALSKVSEEASSLDKESSGEHASGPSGRGIVTDRDGRQGTSAVLGNIHEQEQEDRRRSSESLEMNSVEAQRWRGYGLPESTDPSDIGINPQFLQPLEGLPSSSAQSSSRQSRESISRLSQASQAAGSDTSPSQMQRAALQELVKEHGSRSLSASGMRPEAAQPKSRPEPVDDITAAASTAQQSPLESGEPGQTAVPMNESQGENAGKGPEQQTGASQSEAQPAQAKDPKEQGLQPSAFSQTGGILSGPGSQRPLGQGMSEDSANSMGMLQMAGSEQEAAGSSRQGSGPSIGQCRSGSAPTEQGASSAEGLEPADSAWPGNGSLSNAFLRLINNSQKVFGLRPRAVKRQLSSSGNLSSATSSIVEAGEAPGGEAPAAEAAAVEPAKRRSNFGNRGVGKA